MFTYLRIFVDEHKKCSSIFKVENNTTIEARKSARVDYKLFIPYRSIYAFISPMAVSRDFPIERIIH